MNKKIILGLTATALLATSLLAFDGRAQMHQKNNAGCKQGKMMRGGHEAGRHMFVKMIMKLELSDEQRTKIKAIVKKTMQSLPNPKDAFSDSSFDKKAFIKLSKEKRDSKIERKAQMIEDIYAVLNSSQKKDFKTMLDMKEIMKKSKMNSKHCKSKKCNSKR
jgi:Spy/CpxP family protein refolding chaperone